MTLERCTVLVVDDEPYLLPTLRALLSPHYDVVTASCADEAEAAFATRTVHVLLTDQRMPRRSGVQLLEWAAARHPRTIRLLMTGFTELDDAIDAINRGHVYHYLLKPWRTEDLLQVIRNAADKYRLEKKQDELIGELKALNADLERRVEERTRELQASNHLLEQRTRELERLALTDSLTGLLNRRAIEDLLDFELKRHARYTGPVAVGYVDVDHFKQINTEFTQTGGDEALKSLAKVLTACVREVDSVARIGGEEFLVLARETPLDGAIVLSERIRAGVEKARIASAWGEIRLTVSVGVAVADTATDRKVLTGLAAEALREAKASGRNRCVVRVLQPGEAIGV
ncbi:MAG: diguanylate cyclase [Gemmataceae bacterium]